MPAPASNISTNPCQRLSGAYGSKAGICSSECRAQCLKGNARSFTLPQPAKDPQTSLVLRVAALSRSWIEGVRGFDKLNRYNARTNRLQTWTQKSNKKHAPTNENLYTDGAAMHACDDLCLLYIYLFRLSACHGNPQSPPNQPKAQNANLDQLFAVFVRHCSIARFTVGQ